RVLLPGPIPEGETVKLLATAHIGRAIGGSVRHLEAPVQRDGTFSLTVPRSTHDAWLDLESRYLYLDEVVTARPGQMDVQLAPEVAAILVGRVLPPLGASLPNERVKGADIAISCYVAGQRGSATSIGPTAIENNDRVSGGNVELVQDDGTFTITQVKPGVAL